MSYGDDITETGFLVVLGQFYAVGAVLLGDTLGVVAVVGKFELCQQPHTAAGQQERRWRTNS